jgi:hypothetical protein
MSHYALASPSAGDNQKGVSDDADSYENVDTARNSIAPDGNGWSFPTPNLLIKSADILVLIHIKRYHRVRSVTTPPELYPAIIRTVPSHATRCPDVRSPTALQ